MALIDKVKSWILGVALKKSIKRMAYIIAAWFTAKGAVLAGSGAQVTIDPDKLAVAIYGLWEMGRNWLKIKYPEKFGWL